MTITGGQAITALREIVDEYGADTRYGDRYEFLTDQKWAGYGDDDGDTCMYQIAGSPGCIVGHVFSRLGVEYSPEFEAQDVATLFKRGKVDIDENAARVLQRAQVRQDLGDTWGQALAAAEAVF